MLYGAAVWDPALIIAQIISVQCCFYVSMGLMHLIFVAPYVGRLTLGHFFEHRLLSFKHFSGWMVVAAHLANAPLGAVFLVWIVERAKKCLDYGSTCYFFHLIACWSYGGFPTSLAWWVTNGICLLIMSLLGEWFCVRREMAEIPLGTLRGRPSEPTLPTVPSHTMPSIPPDARTAFASGGGRGSATSSTAGARTTSLNLVSRLGLTSIRTTSTAGGAVSKGGGLQMSALTGGGASGEQGRVSRSNSRSRLLGGDEEV